jgi:hypothetical protein
MPSREPIVRGEAAGDWGFSSQIDGTPERDPATSCINITHAQGVSDASRETEAGSPVTPVGHVHESSPCFNDPR